MGTICILLGVIFLIGFTGGGFYLSNAIVSDMSIQSALTILEVKDFSIVYVIVVGLCALIGFLVFMNLLMHGVNSIKLGKLQAQLKRIKRGEH